jgi:hypothetical protein
MTDLERYLSGQRHCAKMAEEAVTAEIRALWLTVERSYRFLLDRAERMARDSQAV